MPFYLNIECSKDIQELHINFADGTSSVQTVGEPKKKEKVSQKPKQTKKSDEHTSTRATGTARNDVLDLDQEFGSITKDVVKPPEIVREERTTNVAPELQNLDI